MYCAKNCIDNGAAVIFLAAPVPPFSAPQIDRWGFDGPRKLNILFDMIRAHRLVLLRYWHFPDSSWPPWFTLQLMNEGWFTVQKFDQVFSETVGPRIEV